MAAYVLRRVLWGIVLLALVSLLTFVIFDVLPSADPAQLRAGRDASPATLHEIRVSLGLDRPLPAQYWTYVTHLVFHADLGYSYFSGASVGSLLIDRLPATISLTLGAVVVWLARRCPARRDLGGAPRHVGRQADDRRRAAGGLRARLLARARRAVPVRRRHRQVAAAPGAGSYVPFTDNPGKWFGVADPAVARARLDVRRRLRAAAARQHDRGAVRGLRAHGAREGAERAARRLAPRVARGRDAARHARGARRRPAARRRGPHRDGLRHPRHRPPSTTTPILHARLTPLIQGTVLLAALLRDRREHRRRRGLRLPRPAGASGVSAPDAAGAVLRVEDLRVGFDTRDGLVQAVDGVSFAVAPGRTLGIVGESGSGKTVAATTAMGLSRGPRVRVSGRVLLDGEDLLGAAPERLRALRGDAIAMVFQDPLSALHPLLRVGAQIGEAVRAHRSDVTRAAARARAVELLELGRRFRTARQRVDAYPARAVGRHAAARDDRDGAGVRAASC